MDIKNIILSINPCIYGLNYHDPCAIIISDGVILYGIEEERINRIKGAKGIFPVNAVKECIDFCCRNNLKIKDVVIGYDPALWMDRLNLELKRIIRNNSFYDELKNEEGYNAQKIISEIIQSDLINRFHFYSDINNVKKLVYSKIGLEDGTVPITFYEHHLCHIASAYEVSGFTDALGIVVDGIGETESTSVWEIHNHQYKRLLKIEFPNSLGYFYAILTKFLNFKPWQQEGKTISAGQQGLSFINWASFPKKVLPQMWTAGSIIFSVLKISILSDDVFIDVSIFILQPPRVCPRRLFACKIKVGIACCALWHTFGT